MEMEHYAGTYHDLEIQIARKFKVLFLKDSFRSGETV